MSTLASSPRAHHGPRFAATVVALTVATAAMALAGLPVAVRPAALAGLAVALLVGVPLRWHLAAGAVAWALHTGFAVNAYGELTLGPADLSLLALLLLAVPAVSSVVLLSARLRRWGSRRAAHGGLPPLGSAVGYRAKWTTIINLPRPY